MGSIKGSKQTKTSVYKLVGKKLSEAVGVTITGKQCSDKMDKDLKKKYEAVRKLCSATGASESTKDRTKKTFRHFDRMVTLFGDTLEDLPRGVVHTPPSGGGIKSAKKSLKQNKSLVTEVYEEGMKKQDVFIDRLLEFQDARAKDGKEERRERKEERLEENIKKQQRHTENVSALNRLVSALQNPHPPAASPPHMIYPQHPQYPQYNQQHQVQPQPSPTQSDLTSNQFQPVHYNN